MNENNNNHLNTYENIEAKNDALNNNTEVIGNEKDFANWIDEL